MPSKWQKLRVTTQQGLVRDNLSSWRWDGCYSKHLLIRKGMQASWFKCGLLSWSFLCLRFEAWCSCFCSWYYWNFLLTIIALKFSLKISKSVIILINKTAQQGTMLYCWVTNWLEKSTHNDHSYTFWLSHLIFFKY
jgi:hypothetical protein